MVQGLQDDLAAGLLAARAADGGWSATADGPPDTESTAWALIALQDMDDGPSAAAAAGRDWLLQQQRPDGAWPVWPGVPVPGWTTALAILTLADSDEQAAVRGAEWLLGSRGRRSSWTARTLIRLGWLEPSVELDHSLTGFPWVPDTFAWVEPTSWAILALRAVQGRVSETERRNRTEEATELLVDRACVGGGWNYGNRTVLGEDLWPYPDTTAIALLALVERPDHPAVEAGFRSLAETLGRRASRLSLALGALALTAHGRDAGGLRTRLEAAWKDAEDFIEPTTRARALSLLALSGRAWPGAVPLQRDA